jgi:MscS family membrane protein
VETVKTIISSPWAAVAGIVLGGAILGRILLAIVRPILARVARRSAWQWDDLFVGAIATPFSLLLAVASVRIAAPWLPLDPRGRELVGTVTGLAAGVLLLWAAFGLVNVAVRVLSERPWAEDRPATRSLLQIGGRFAKVILVVLAGIGLLAYLGVSVASLIAGFGIGGLALALAAQKTVENLFGTVSIGLDQPMREGDFVKIGDYVGTVERIGLRSTRLRTLDRTLVTIPNGQLADLKIESFAVRDRIRLACTIGVVYETSVEQMRGVLEGLRRVLRAHPKIWPDAVVVRFKEFGESSLDIEVMAWFETSDWGEFQGIREEILLQFMEVVAGQGTEFAFPSRTLYTKAAAGQGTNASAPPVRADPR